MSQTPFSLETFYSSVARQDRSDVGALLNYFKSFERIVLWGAGRLGTDICACLKNLGVDIDSVWDNKASEGKTIFGVPVAPPYSKVHNKSRELIIVCVGGEVGEAIRRELHEGLFKHVIDGKRLIDAVRNPFNSETGEHVFRRYPDQDVFQYQTTDGYVIDAGTDSPLYAVTDTAPETLSFSTSCTVLRNLDCLSDEAIRAGRFYVYFQVDSDALPVLRRIRDAGGKFIPHIDPFWRKNHYRFVNKYAYIAMQRTWGKHERLSHLIPVVHENICEALELTKNISGDYVEIGVYLGGSAATALHYLDQVNPSGKKAWLLDTYNGFNYQEAEDSFDALWARTHGLFGVEGTISFIRQTLGDIQTCHELIASNICQDVLPSQIRSISVANIDVDMYEPTLAALGKVAPLIPKGGIIISEDPASTPGTYGALLAMHEFLATQQGSRFMPIFKRGQYFLLAMS